MGQRSYLIPSVHCLTNHRASCEWFKFGGCCSDAVWYFGSMHTNVCAFVGKQKGNSMPYQHVPSQKMHCWLRRPDVEGLSSILQVKERTTSDEQLPWLALGRASIQPPRNLCTGRSTPRTVVATQVPVRSSCNMMWGHHVSNMPRVGPGAVSKWVSV